MSTNAETVLKVRLPTISLRELERFLRRANRERPPFLLNPFGRSFEACDRRSNGSSKSESFATLLRFHVRHMEYEEQGYLMKKEIKATVLREVVTIALGTFRSARWILVVFRR